MLLVTLQACSWFLVGLGRGGGEGGGGGGRGEGQGGEGGEGGGEVERVEVGEHSSFIEKTSKFK